MSCNQPWQNASDPGSSECPYGWAIHGFDVTIPSDVTFSLGMCIAYGLTPYLVILCSCFWFNKNRTLGSAAFPVLPGVVAGLGKVWKAIVQSPRPLGTCLINCGMPSSHAQVAASYISWLFLEAYAHKSARATLTHRLSWTLFWLVLFGPVPPCRVHLKDHSLQQIVIGGLVGAVEGIIWYWLMAYVRLSKRCARLRESKLLAWHDGAPPLLKWWMGPPLHSTTPLPLQGLPLPEKDRE
ncbi:hypothetical protein TeGR_g9938 [Tetraparma gracilis]|uniref:Dolichyldiphosphatase n=1 Tax=Tetraparma gracilis TaxID=2962635 RepID=A0ABQ6NB97_9STRA|nr:hypothetical protein TeGR_g9938 [Tetraparma gracilis]